MRIAEVERFVADLKSDEGLRDELAGHASGIGSIVAFATDKGYDITTEEASAYIQAQAGSDLSDEQLDGIAGGKGRPAAAATVTQVVVGPAAIAASVVTGLVGNSAAAVIVLT